RRRCGRRRARRARRIRRQRRRRHARPRGRRPRRRRRHSQSDPRRTRECGAYAPGRRAVMSNFFIDRPLFATVVSAFIVIAGLAAFRELPVAMYPNVAPPQISVATVYPGASSDVIAETVAAPLEQALNGVENMLYMRSTSSSTGSLSIALTFAVGTNPDLSMINVQNRV